MGQNTTIGLYTDDDFLLKKANQEIAGVFLERQAVMESEKDFFKEIKASVKVKTAVLSYTTKYQAIYINTGTSNHYKSRFCCPRSDYRCAADAISIFAAGRATAEPIEAIAL